MIYQWKPNVSVKAEAQAVGDRLEQLREEAGGFLTPDTVVADARSKRSPLHPCFEWDDRKAAVAHRIDQARYILRNLVVSIDVIDREPAIVRAFLSVTPPEDADEEHETAYTSVEQALRDPPLRKQVIDRARMEFQSLRRKYSDLTELADVFRAIDQFKLDSEAEKQ